ncbi:MAG: HDOD domain-containing protein [Thermodesulfobacteriota bacterium]
MPLAVVKHQHIDSLPSPPALLAGLMRALDDDGASAERLESMISQDQSTTGLLLSVANSAYYGLRYEVTSVARAVVVLGLGEVRAICLGSVLAGLLHPRRFADPDAAMALWRHSLYTQEAARLLARRCGGLREDVALTAGLLHDLGWVVILVYRPDLWMRLNTWLGEGASLLQAEQRLGFSHQQAGGVLARQWDLPPLLATVMTTHHQPQMGGEHAEAVCLLHLADRLASELGQGAWAEPEPALPDSWILAGRGLGPADWDDCRAEFKARAEAMEALYAGLLGGRI